MKIDTTYINRVNTNASIYTKINDMMEQEGRTKRVVSFVDAYRKLKWKKAVRVLKQEGSSIYNVSFENGKLRKWVHDKRRVGRPRANWTEETIKEIWDKVKQSNIEYRYKPFDENNEEMVRMIKNFEVT